MEFRRMCIVSTVIGVITLALDILVTATKGWLSFHVTDGNQKFSHNLGAFDIPRVFNSAVATLQAMLVLSIIILMLAIACQIVAATKKKIFCFGPKGFLITVHVLYILSALFLLIGMSVFTKNMSPGMNISVRYEGYRGSFSYGYSFYISWLLSVLFMIFSLSYVVFATFFVTTY
uniref:Uncharacterized protein n=1 Tax=Ciona intestinalis TaxID=7719 RepID=H2Y1P4_CIOIN